MDSKEVILLIVVGFVVLIAAKMVYDGVIRKKKLIQKIKRAYGKLPENDYSAARYQDDGISHYYRNKQCGGPVVDDITWNDLDMDTIYMILNNTLTGVGEEYLYDLLRRPCMNDELLKERDRIADYMDEHEQERVKIQYELIKLGKLRASSVSQYLTAVRSMKPHNPLPHIACFAGLTVSIIGSIFNPVSFLPFLFIMIVINMAVYFKRKSSISSYFIVFSYLARMTQTAVDLYELKCSGIESYNARLKECVKPLGSIRRFSWMFTTGTDLSADLLAIVFDYIKMMTHIDLMTFDYLASRLFKYREQLDEMMEMIGEIDCDIAIGSYRRYMKEGQQTPVCKPVLSKEGSVHIHTENIYHPMIVNPVTNSLEESRCVLLTGSNASGKSTFLKTIAINAIFAQTIYTCLADRYESRFFRIYSSMALQDNIQSSESYYIVEIKSLKRIIDAAQKDDPVPVLCFIDEVLRGTNTVERIAASSRILQALSQMNVLCFAATHDIELTKILEHSFANYHFQEEVTDEEVTFDYILYPGRAVSRNAIKLLGMIGFDEGIIKAAQNAAKDFEISGQWNALN